MSVKRTVTSSDLRVQEFLKICKDHPLRSNQVPEPVKRSTEKHLKFLAEFPDTEKELRLINYELLHFYLLDQYLLPAYVRSGDPGLEEQILHCLVQLRDISSQAELYLQAKSLFTISQGGYYYPELQTYLASAIQKQKASSHPDKKTDLSRAQDLIESLQSKSQK